MIDCERVLLQRRKKSRAWSRPSHNQSHRRTWRASHHTSRFRHCHRLQKKLMMKIFRLLFQPVTFTPASLAVSKSTDLGPTGGCTFATTSLTWLSNPAFFAVCIPTDKLNDPHGDQKHYLVTCDAKNHVDSVTGFSLLIMQVQPFHLLGCSALC